MEVNRRAGTRASQTLARCGQVSEVILARVESRPSAVLDYAMPTAQVLAADDQKIAAAQNYLDQ